MYGVSKISVSSGIVLISLGGERCQLCDFINLLSMISDEGIIIDMISHTPPTGNNRNFSFSASSEDMMRLIEIIGSYRAQHNNSVKPMVSDGHSKIALYGEDMANAYGVAYSVLKVLLEAGIEPVMITTSESDISILVGSHEETLAVSTLNKAFDL